MILNLKHYILDIKRLAIVFFGKPLVNYLNILYKYSISRITGNIHVSKMPFALSAEVSAICNLNCPECMVGSVKTNRNEDFMDKRIFENILSESSRWSFYLNLYFQGEPFLNPQIFDYITQAYKKRFYTVVSTNGHFLNENNNKRILNSHLNRLIISLDGISPETYIAYRKNGQFNKVIEGIKNLTYQRKIQEKTHPLIVLQFLVNKINEKEIPYLKSYAKEIGVDYVQLKTMQFYNRETIKEMLPADNRFRRYGKTKDGLWKIKKNKNNLCFRLWSQLVVTTDGKVVPCCYDKKPEYISGNVLENNIKKIWKSEKLNKFRYSVLRNKDIPDICKNCIG